MVVTFALKQRAHLRAVRLLVIAGLTGDATIIVRTMSEGLAQLLWAYRSLPEGPKMWFWYGIVLDWRHLHESVASGLPVEPATLSSVDALVAEHGYRFLTKVAQKCQEMEQPLPADPYRNRWHAPTMETIFESVGGETMYRTVYRPVSERVHWNPREMFRSLDRDVDGRSGYVMDDASSGLSALLFGLQSLLQCMEVADDHFNLNLTAELVDIVQSIAYAPTSTH